MVRVGGVCSQIVTVVGKKVVGLWRVDLLQGLKILQDDVHGKIGTSQFDDFFRCAMVGGAGIAGLHTGAVEILNATKHNGGVVNGVDLDPEELAGELPC